KSGHLWPRSGDLIDHGLQPVAGPKRAGSSESELRGPEGPLFHLVFQIAQRGANRAFKRPHPNTYRFCLPFLRLRGEYNVRFVKVPGYANPRRSMANSSDFSRRGFLATTGGVIAGAVAAPHSLSAAAPQSGESNPGARPRRKIPIGVFDPAFPDLTVDQLIDRYVSMGVEAAEIGTGGYPNNKHCPMPDLLADPAKLKAWRKKFDDHNIII